MTVAGKKAEEEEGVYKMVKLKVLTKEKDKLKFLVEDTTPGYINMLRRIMISEVPTMAMEEIEFRKNNSVLYDEIIAHRLGLVPLTSDIKSYNFRKDCKCKGEGCARCTLKLTLKTKGPKTVYASDLKSSDPKIKPVFPNTPIAVLLKDQELEVEATAVLGFGKEHMKWSPGHVYFRVKPDIKIDNRKIKNPDAIAQSCPQKVFEVKSGKLVVNEKKLYDCNLCHTCADMDEGIELVEEEKDYIMYLESWGQLPPKEMLSKSLEVFDEKLEDFVKSL